MTRSRPLALIVFLLASTPAAAQTFGVKGGVNLATQTSADGGSALDPRTALVTGAFVRLPLASWLDLQVEGLYAMKGAKLDFLGVKSTLAIDYLEVPALAQVRIGSGRRHYFVGGGPSVALRLRAKTRTRFSGASEEVDVADQIERLDYGVAAGGGIEIGSLVVDARYTLGLRNIDKTEGGSTKNRTISVTAGFRF
jgi:hypothetical protein